MGIVKKSDEQKLHPKKRNKFFVSYNNNLSQKLLWQTNQVNEWIDHHNNSIQGPNQSCCQQESPARRCETQLSGSVGTKEFQSILNEVWRIAYNTLQIEQENQISFHSYIKRDGHYSNKTFKSKGVE